MSLRSKNLIQTYQPGDKVIIVDADRDTMRKYIGTEATIQELYCWSGSTKWYILVGFGLYGWNAEYLMPAHEYKNIDISQENIIEMFGEKNV